MMSLNQTKKRITALTLVLVLLATVISGDLGHTKDTKGDWPQWRGPNRDGISLETGILKRWPEAGPHVIWRAPAGDGYSAISIAGKHLFTIYGKLGNEVVVCLNSDSGELLWEYVLDSKFTNQFGHGSRSTPTINNGIVYALSAQGKLAALSADKGTEIWKLDLRAKYGAKIPTWGVATSPLVYDNFLLVDVGGDANHGFMAFDKKTGKLVWETATQAPGYSAPIAVNVGGVEHILNFAGKSLISVDPGNGRKRWSYPWQTSYDVNAATPVFIAPDKVFISSGYDVGAAVLKINKSSAETVWKSKAMRNHFSSSVFLDGYLYGFDEATLRCIDAKTQESVWAKRGFGKGSFIYADGHLILLSERGLLVLIEATPTEYIEKASAQMLKGRCWTAPTLLNGKLYIRNQKEILCLDFASKA